MAVRAIIRIDEEKCTGCGQCIPGCAEGALQIVDGKAQLIGEIYCDGLGACLGECPEGALTLEKREADPFDEEAVEALVERQHGEDPLPCGCPGSAMRALQVDDAESSPNATTTASALTHWPVQLMLVPPGAPFLREADLLVCADCVPFAMPDLHARYIAGRAVLVGCPKLDDANHYRAKLEGIFREAQPKSITVLRMEVSCCGGLAHIVSEAHEAAGLSCPLEIRIVEVQGGGTRP
ncbi:ATP-binding protein [Candidatus Bipolaricaulota bacterium]